MGWRDWFKFDLPVPPADDVPEPGGLPPVLPSEVLPSEVPPEETVRVWVHESPEGVKFVHPDTVMELLRKMSRGSASGIFCDQYELNLRRMMDNTRTPK